MTRPRLRGAAMSIRDRTLDALLDHLRTGLNDDSREISSLIGALVLVDCHR